MPWNGEIWAKNVAVDGINLDYVIHSESALLKTTSWLIIRSQS